MKEKSNSVYVIAAASVITASTLAWAQPAATVGASTDTTRGTVTSTQGPSGATAGGAAKSDDRNWERQYRASKIIGTDVRNKQGEKIGDIKDLIMDRNGSITLVIVSTGGFLGLGDRLHAVPWSALQTTSGNDRVLDIDKDRLKRAPGFDSGNWPNLSDERWISENRRYYGATKQ